MNNDHTQYMQEKRKTVTVRLSPSEEEFRKIHAKYDLYGESEAFEAEANKYATEYILTDVSLHEAQTFAEPLRMAHPNQCVSISADDCYIGNTSWADQMEMFWEYEVYTEAGKSARMMRRRVAEKKGIIASYS